MGQNELKKKLQLNNRYGLHARPAALFVELCNRFNSEIHVSKDGTQVNGKNILDIMMLGAEPGSELEIIASGEDAKNALEEITKLIESNFGET